MSQTGWYALVGMEPMTGIEPAYLAWEAISRSERVSEYALVDGLQARRNLAV